MDYVAGPRSSLQGIGFVRLEVAGMLVDIDPDVDTGNVQFGVELSGIDVAADTDT